MSQYVYSKLTGNGSFRPDNICRDKYYEPCRYCSSKDGIWAYYQYQDWRKYSQRHILVSYYRSRYKISKTEADAMVNPDHVFYYYRFYCDQCKAKYLECPILGANSMDDDGESAVEQATSSWNNRILDQGKLLYWER